jgi:hypothetical protein
MGLSGTGYPLGFLHSPSSGGHFVPLKPFLMSSIKRLRTNRRYPPLLGVIGQLIAFYSSNEAKIT